MGDRRVRRVRCRAVEEASPRTRPIRDSGRRNEKERDIGERACAIEERSNGFKPWSDEEKLLESGKGKVTSRG